MNSSEIVANNNFIISEEEKSQLERIMDSNIPKGIVAVVDQVPQDVKQLTIRNLDTGEEFIIGETDPDFDFDTFELGARRGSTGSVEQNKRDESTDIASNDSPPVSPVLTSDTAVALNGTDAQGTLETAVGESKEPTPNLSSPATPAAPRRGFFSRLYQYLFKSSSNDAAVKSTKATDSNHSTDALGANKPFKTPFTKLSSFKFRRELGRGAFGRVLLAQAKVDGQLYALKIISKKDMRTSDKRQAKAERDILHAMGHTAPHPFTAGLRFAFQSVNHLYLGMDFFPGGNLRELIKKYGSLPEDWVRFYATELVLAISHMHSLNVLYRDIKPHNVMLDGRGHIVLIDFGLSKQEISHPRGAMSLVGTPDYSAPEVLKTGVYQIEQFNKQKVDAAGKRIDKLRAANKGRRDNRTNSADEIASPKPLHIGYGKAADWWSVGVMIYEMIGGTPAFRGADLRETYQKVLFGALEFKPAEKFSSTARQLITGLLQRDPSLRLGAWAIPPTDIMRQPFFHGVDWEAVLRKESDGPWVPEPVVYPLPQSVTDAKIGMREHHLVAPVGDATQPVESALSPTSPVTLLGEPVSAPVTNTTTQDASTTPAATTTTVAGAGGASQAILTTGIVTTEPGAKQMELLTADMSADRAAQILKSGSSCNKQQPSAPATTSVKGEVVETGSNSGTKQYDFRTPVNKAPSTDRAALDTPATVGTFVSDASPSGSPVGMNSDDQENKPANLIAPVQPAAASLKTAPKFTHMEAKDEGRRMSTDITSVADTTKAVKESAPVTDDDELIPNRDSIFISSSASHAVAGWSFVDVRAIRMALNNGKVSHQ